MIFSQENDQKPRFGPVLGPFAPILGREIFFQHFAHHYLLDIMVLYHNMQNQRNLMIFSRENDQKPCFGPVLGPFGPILGQDIFFRKSGFVTLNRL